MSITKKLFFIMAIMLVLITTELVALTYTIKIFSAVRTYVGGEGLWSKAQKDGAYYLLKYAYTHNEKDYQLYLNFMKVPLSDHQARLALLKNPVDYHAAQLGFWGGGIQKEDIDGIIWLFHHFNRIYYINNAFKIWTQGDILLHEFMKQGAQLHQSISVNHANSADISKQLEHIDQLNTQLTTLENNFSYALGNASRWFEHVILKILISIAVTVEFTGIISTIIIGLRISKNINAMNHVAHKVAKSDFSERVTISSKDEIGQLAISFNKMIDELDEHDKRQTLLEKKFKSIIENAPYAMIITNQEGTVMITNRQTQVLFGYQWQHLIGENIELLISESCRQYYLSYRKSLFSNPNEPVLKQSCEMYGLRKNGHEFPIEVSLSSIETEEGILISSAIRDITDKKNNEQMIIQKNIQVEKTNRFLEQSLENQKKISKELTKRTQLLEEQTFKTKLEQSSKNLLFNILDSATEYSIVATDLDGVILVWNEGAHRLYGYQVDELVQKKTMYILFLPEDIQSGRVKQFFEAVLLKDKAESIFERVRKDGTHFFDSFVATLRRDNAGNPVGYDMISKDITKQKALEEQLIKKNQELEQFAYITSHDLKAPLRAIDRLANWIQEDNTNNLKIESKEHLALLRQRVNRMSHLISGILQYSRTGLEELPIHPIDTKSLLQGIIENLSQSKNFKIQYDNNLPIIEANETQLTQVFSNLIDNSIKHHDSKTGKINVGVHNLDDFYEFFVTDNGPGIEPAYHQKIFQIFQTLKSRDELESTGIGLSIVKKIVESQGGTIRLESSLGKGATFYFTWPKYRKPLYTHST